MLSIEAEKASQKSYTNVSRIFGMLFLFLRYKPGLHTFTGKRVQGQSK